MNAIDTNVLIYACDQRHAEKHLRSMSLLRDLDGAVMLWQVAVEFIAATRRLETQGFTRVNAWDRLDELLVRFPLVLPSVSVLAAAKPLHLEQGVAFWDAMIYAACVESGITTLYSEDVPGLSIPELRIINPFAEGKISS